MSYTINLQNYSKSRYGFRNGEEIIILFINFKAKTTFFIINKKKSVKHWKLFSIFAKSK